MRPTVHRHSRDRREVPIMDVVRRRIAILITAFSIPGILALFSESGPAPGAPRIIAILILLSTIPVAAFVYVARRSIRWWRRRRNQHLVAFVFTVYADVGTSIFLFLCSNDNIALAGCALFAVISCFVAFFAGRATVVAHLLVTTAIISWTTYAVVRHSQVDTLAVIAASFSIWLAVNATMSIVSTTSNTLHRDLEEQIGHAQTDPLTGLLNMRGLELAADRHLRCDQLAGFLLIDLDHFKWVNDLHGHLAGDDVLALAAERVRDHLSERGLAARRGGEEFLVVVDARQTNPTVLAESVRSALFDVTDRIPVSVSIGVSVVDTAGLGTTDAQAVVNIGMHLADIAMYRAKAAGRNTVVVFDDPAGGFVAHSQQK